MLAGDYVDWLSSERVMKEKETRTRSGKKKTRISLMFNLIQKKVTWKKILNALIALNIRDLKIFKDFFFSLLRGKEESKTCLEQFFIFFLIA